MSRLFGILSFESMQELDKIDTKERDANKEANAFVVATNRIMRVTKGSDVMNVILYTPERQPSHHNQLLTKSDRVSEDISKTTPFGRELFDMKLVIREWLEEVPHRPQYEFRSFVHNNQLNALVCTPCAVLSRSPLRIRHSILASVNVRLRVCFLCLTNF